MPLDISHVVLSGLGIILAIMTKSYRLQLYFLKNTCRNYCCHKGTFAYNCGPSGHLYIISVVEFRVILYKCVWKIPSGGNKGALVLPGRAMGVWKNRLRTTKYTTVYEVPFHSDCTLSHNVVNDPCEVTISFLSASS